MWVDGFGVPRDLGGAVETDGVARDLFCHGLYSFLVVHRRHSRSASDAVCLYAASPHIGVGSSPSFSIALRRLLSAFGYCASASASRLRASAAAFGRSSCSALFRAESA